MTPPQVAASGYCAQLLISAGPTATSAPSQLAAPFVTPTAAPSARLVRVDVTVLFCDLLDSTWNAARC